MSTYAESIFFLVEQFNFCLYVSWSIMYFTGYKNPGSVPVFGTQAHESEEP